MHSTPGLSKSIDLFSLDSDTLGCDRHGLDHPGLAITGTVPNGLGHSGLLQTGLAIPGASPPRRLSGILFPGAKPPALTSQGGFAPPGFITGTLANQALKIDSSALAGLRQPLGFHHHRLDHQLDCPPVPRPTKRIGHLWDLHSLGKTQGLLPQACSKTGFPPMRSYHPGHSPALVLAVPGALTPGLLPHALPILLISLIN